MNDEILSGLNPAAQTLATNYLVAFPGDTLTSGRRTVAQQAAAMAENVLQNSQWIKGTYVAAPVSQACQEAVDGLTQPLQLDVVTAALEGVLSGYSDADLRTLSWHLSGDAFDVQPVDDPGGIRIGTLEALIKDHITAGGEAKFLQKEAGLTRWHCQVA